MALTVLDDDGERSTAEFDLAVRNAAPVVTALNLSETTIDENGTVELSGGFSDLGVQDLHAVQVDWGDGQRIPRP